MRRVRPVVLVIMDGWGIAAAGEGNAITGASTPNFEQLKRRFPYIELRASGESVGLPEGQMGNSEVGHLNIGAGRIVYQDLTRISRAIATGDFKKNDILLDACRRAGNKHSLHLIGLLSDGGVHSHIEHLFALMEMACRENVEKLYIHPILDGRDVPPACAAKYISALQEKISELGLGRIATLAGRYYAMDRDKRWDRTEKAYRAYVYRQGRRAASAEDALQSAYEQGETDEFVLPAVIGDEGSVCSGDSVIFFNFRPDRARQISRAFVDKQFDEFDRGEKYPLPYYVCMAEYDASISAPVAFPPEYLRDTLGETVSRAGLKQLRAAETEKYAHVTFFFNGGREEPFPGEDRILIPSPSVATYDLQPQMSAVEVKEKVINALSEDYSLVTVNFANPDMVGHTGDIEAAKTAVETVDGCIGEITELAVHAGGAVLLTADHGNAEKMLTPKGEKVTAHTTNPVPFILVYNPVLPLKQGGILADIAPTVLDLLGLKKPEAMTGTSLIAIDK